MPVVINGSTGISGTDGSAGTPAVQGLDTNTGMFFPAADTIAFAEGGVEVMRIDSSGNVGVGTNAPLSALHVLRTSGSVNARFQNTNGPTYIDLTSSGSSNESFYNSINTDYTSGSRYWRTGVRSGPLYVVGEKLNDAASSITFTPISINSSNQIIFGGTTKRVTSPNNPAVEIDTTGCPGGLGIYVPNNLNNQTSVVFQNTNGRVGFIDINSTSTTYATSSDYRLKTNVEPLTGAIDRLTMLPVHRFNWTVNPDGPKVDGFIAHEAADVVPEAVSGEKDAVTDDGIILAQGIDQSKLVPLLTAALKEAVTKINALETRIAALEGASA